MQRAACSIGRKGKGSEPMRFTNSDPEMALILRMFLKTNFKLRDDEIKITCNLFADHLERNAK